MRLPSYVDLERRAFELLRRACERHAGELVINRTAASIGRARRTFWFEWSREMKRQAGDERLPLALRARLREQARRALARAQDTGGAGVRFPRRLLRARASVVLPASWQAQVRRLMDEAGLDPQRPVVAVDVRRRPDTCDDACAWLVARGYAVVQIGPVRDPVQARGVVALAGSARRPDLELAILLRATFLVCDSLAIQYAAYLTNTPALLLNARDPFCGYPVREGGLFTLGAPIDLDSGRVLAPGDLFGEEYYRTGRHLGYRDLTPAAVLAAVREMHEGVTGGWHDSPSQARFRQRVAAAGAALALRVPGVAAWGPDEGFIGDGRLARWQADAIEAGGFA
ncbi:MAG TPA: hypothetical protein VNI78_05935 [Vicinamibacterales bacterium]|nr:hypothetical protein [Vicinamibacterales bacterium]